MNPFACLCFLIAGSLVATASGSPGDSKAIQGIWRPSDAELAGQPMAAEVVKSIRLELHDGKYEVHVGTQPDKGTYTLDAKSHPKSLTIKGTEGPNQGKTILAIYELQGDKLKICYDLSGATRPTEFNTVTNTQLFLVHYSRTKE